MIDVLILFPRDASPQELDGLVARMIPDLKEAEGLTSLRVSAGDLMGRGGPPPYSRVIEASFRALPDFMAFVGIPTAGAGSGVRSCEPLVSFEVTEA